jgi:aldose 1-epimerase
MVNLVKLSTSIGAALKAVWSGGSPFATVTALWPTNEEGKYIIQAEGIRLALTNHGAAVTNLWINDTNGEEIDIVLGLDHADLYPELTSNPYLNGFIGQQAPLSTSLPTSNYIPLTPEARSICGSHQWCQFRI